MRLPKLSEVASSEQREALLQLVERTGWPTRRTQPQDALDVAARWFRLGAPEAHLAPQLRGQAAAGPASIDLTGEELATLEVALVTAMGTRQSRAGASPMVDALVARGVLVRTRRTVALEPSHLSTVGFAAWHTRSITIRQRGTGAQPGPWIVTYCLVGTRGVELLPLPGGTRISSIDSATVADRLAALADPGRPEAQAGYVVELSWQHDAGAGAPPRDRAEDLQLTVDARGVGWGSSHAPGRTERLGHDAAEVRLRRAVARGEATDLQASRDVEAAKRRLDQRFSNRHDIAGAALDEFVWPGLGDGRKADWDLTLHRPYLDAYWDVRSS